MTPNPGLLKYDLAIRGARLGGGVAEHPDLRRDPADAGAARSLECVLPEELWVSVPVDAARAARSPYELRAEGDGFVIASGDGRTEVRIVPPPRFYGETTRAGTPMWQVGSTSGGALAINPAAGCAVARRGLPCLFCELLAQTPERAEPIPVADVIDTVRAAFAEGAVEFVYLHAGHHEGDDAGVEFLEPYVRAIKRHFDTLVAVQLQAPRTNGWIDRTYAMGVDALSYSVGLHDANRLAVLRAERATPARTHEALRHAAAIFPSGTVWSDLIVGMEPAASTIAGIDTLVEAGVLPVLSLVQPLDDAVSPTPEEAAPLFAHLFTAVRKARINMHWVRDLSFAVTPLEARVFTDDGRAGAGLGTFYRSRLGSLAARNLSRLRRRLRVRQVSDSFDSSQL